VTSVPGEWSRRYKANVGRLRSGSLSQIALVIEDLESRKHAFGLSTGERRMLTRAVQILHAEVSRRLPPARITERVEVVPAGMAAWCRNQLGSETTVVRYEGGHRGGVYGVGLANDQLVALKARPYSGRVVVCEELHRRLWEAGFPCAEPLAGPDRLGDLLVTADRWVDDAASRSHLDHPVHFGDPAGPPGPNGLEAPAVHRPGAATTVGVVGSPRAGNLAGR
jgi:hypothetical protein